jgi:hypothetical protein
MIIAEKYSIRPWPKGCERLAGFSLNFVPTIVITDESASLRLFTASMIIAIELANNPTTALNEARKMLATIPITLVRTIILLLSISTNCYVFGG